MLRNSLGCMSGMKRELKVVVMLEGDVFVARCLDIEVASDGVTEQEALSNLREALELYFEDDVSISISLY